MEQLKIKGIYKGEFSDMEQVQLDHMHSCVAIHYIFALFVLHDIKFMHYCVAIHYILALCVLQYIIYLHCLCCNTLNSCTVCCNTLYICTVCVAIH